MICMYIWRKHASKYEKNYLKVVHVVTSREWDVFLCVRGGTLVYIFVDFDFFKLCTCIALLNHTLTKAGKDLEWDLQQIIHVFFNLVTASKSSKKLSFFSKCCIPKSWSIYCPFKRLKKGLLLISLALR